MVSDETRALVDEAQEAFRARVAAVTAVGSVPAIDWKRYKDALPGMNIDALRADYEAYVSKIPAIAYDAEKDKAKHQDEEDSFIQLSSYAKGRLVELKELAAEAEEHKLHDHYTVARAFQRFDGLYEKEWLEWQNLNFESNLRSFAEVPEELSSEERTELARTMAEGLNATPAELGVKKASA